MTQREGDLGRYERVRSLRFGLHTIQMDETDIALGTQTRQIRSSHAVEVRVGHTYSSNETRRISQRLLLCWPGDSLSSDAICSVKAV